jgi:CTP:phosphocholine cytidylyltransferase-like protein/thiamine kinase-like enzyme
MTKEEFDLLVRIKADGALFDSTKISGQLYQDLAKKGFVKDSKITEQGIKAIAPYKVDNAIIMAAGLSSRFVPLSLEKPKGLFVVKGEVLIERQIRQLKEAGISDIIVVVGYKKEAFFYLEDKFGVKILTNSSFNTKNNLETLYVARDYLKNTYICSSDNYFAKNVFEPYVYSSYYASTHVEEKSNEWFMFGDAAHRVTKVKIGGTSGDIMIGQAYFSHYFSAAFLKLVEEHREMGDYDTELWERLFADNIEQLPPMTIRSFPKDTIFEFDSLDDLRKFDDEYVKHTKSKILDNIASVLKCETSDIRNFAPIHAGLTNTSFIFQVGDTKYVYRHPGDGTNEMVDRKHEKIALELAKKAGVDPTFLYMNDEEGWKISLYVPDIRLPDYQNFEDSKRVLKVMRKLHDQMFQVPWEFDPWEDSKRMEALVRKAGPIEMPDFEELKAKAIKVYEMIKNDNVPKRFCHCDTYGPNWMLTSTQTILIDWEYAGNADPAMDVGGYIMDAMYSIDEAKKLVKEYLGDSDSPQMERHYIGYVALYSYWCVLWALYRESCGAVLGDVLHRWYVMAKRCADYLLS